jgi:purine nucleosidase
MSFIYQRMVVARLMAAVTVGISAAVWTADVGSLPTSAKGKLRIIIDADTANEIDDLFAIVRALIAPEFQVEGLTSSHWLGHDSVHKSQHLNERILDEMGLRETIPHPRGAAKAMPDKRTPVDSPAARHIIARAHAGGPEGKLHVVALGAASNLASALLLDPSIQDKVLFAFIDGDFKEGRWGPGIYNWSNDIHAVQVIFESNVDYHHMPAPTVSGNFIMKKSEVIPRLKGRGGVWDFLAEFWETGGPFFDEKRFGERWIMWDIALVQALLRPELASAKVVGAPRVHDVREVEQFPDNPRRVTVYTGIDVEGMVADFWQAVESAMR